MAEGHNAAVHNATAPEGVGVRQHSYIVHAYTHTHSIKERSSLPPTGLAVGNWFACGAAKLHTMILLTDTTR